MGTFIQAETCLYVSGYVLIQAVGFFTACFRQPLDGEIQVFDDFLEHLVSLHFRTVQFLAVHIQVNFQPRHISQKLNLVEIFQRTEETHFSYINVDIRFGSLHTLIMCHEIIDVTNILPV